MSFDATTPTWPCFSTDSLLFFQTYLFVARRQAEAIELLETNLGNKIGFG
ncbi:MAG: hypothetical protein QNJ54_30020 [Prochloraceae cyanobacterium]|nr:hypothetical protein [Prochloraceae cyanobacterium]